MRNVTVARTASVAGLVIVFASLQGIQRPASAGESDGPALVIDSQSVDVQIGRGIALLRYDIVVKNGGEGTEEGSFSVRVPQDGVPCEVLLHRHVSSSAKTAGVYDLAEAVKIYNAVKAMGLKKLSEEVNLATQSMPGTRMVSSPPGNGFGLPQKKAAPAPAPAPAPRRTDGTDGDVDVFGRRKSGGGGMKEGEPDLGSLLGKRPETPEAPKTTERLTDDPVHRQKTIPEYDDPALLQRMGDGWYSLKCWPVPARDEQRVTVYVVAPLILNGARAGLNIPMDFGTNAARTPATRRQARIRISSTEKPSSFSVTSGRVVSAAFADPETVDAQVQVEGDTFFISFDRGSNDVIVNDVDWVLSKGAVSQKGFSWERAEYCWKAALALRQGVPDYQAALKAKIPTERLALLVVEPWTARQALMPPK